ncbi:hypothetical protein HRbin37_02070 [bacterium HR37]|nr:hypothetical protein HRbin37_02070 [bacterium HR37]
MLVTKDSISSFGHLDHCWEDSDYLFCWKGMVFIEGIPCGVDSIKEFSKEVRRLGLQKACCILKGCYFIVIKDKRRNAFYSFIDNSGLFQAFHSDKAICTSFLKLVKWEGLSKVNLNKEAVVEFIHFGNIFFNKTFFDLIKKIPRQSILSFSEEGKICFSEKLIPDLDEKNDKFSFLDFFEGFVSSIKDEKVSIDLTGGIDSRLLAVLLDYFGLEFETAVVGIRGNQDIEIAKEVASILKHDIHITYHSIDNLEKDLYELFAMCDGLCNILKCHTQLQDNRGRLHRGVSLKLSGAGGELYKDFWWLQDFPFYKKKRANLERLFDLRIAPIPFKHFYLSDDYIETSINIRQKVLKELSKYIRDTNTKTYDNIYFSYKMSEVGGRSLTNNFYSALKGYAPLLELDLVRYGFNLPRRERFFNNFHRKIITSVNPDIARIQTTGSGMSVSSKSLDIIQDIGKYLVNISIRLTKKVAQKYLRRTYFQESPIHPDFYSKLRKLSITKDSIDLLKDEGIINKKIDIDDIDNNYIGNFISLAFLMKYMP